MILSYVFNLVKFKKRRLACFVALIVVGLGVHGILVSFAPSVDRLAEVHKCPACYGISACDYLHKVDIAPLDVLSALSYFFGAKNVFLGKLNEKQIVLKKLAHSSELKEFDRVLCTNNEISALCIHGNKGDYSSNTNFYKLIQNKINLDFTEDDLSRLRLCKSTQHFKNLLHNVYVNNKAIDPKTLEANILTLIFLNPEPLLLQILPVSEGWPVPKYSGACGRIVIEEYVGLPLTAYYNAPWLLRAKIASSLLNAAHMFTFGNKDFGFYFTDISADNIAVDLQNTAKLIDLGNVIVVDKNAPLEERPIGWERLHENQEHLHSPNCFIFSSAEICNHKISDHNYYAVCQLFFTNANDNLLPGGFLHDVPKDILLLYANTSRLIEQCAVPQPPQTRIDAGSELKKLLDTILQELQI